MPGKPWSRDETLAAFNLYCRTPFGRLHARNPTFVISGAWRRLSETLEFESRRDSTAGRRQDARTTKA